VTKEDVEKLIAKYEDELRKAHELELRLQGALIGLRELLKMEQGKEAQ
jgi:hypothetical protein